MKKLIKKIDEFDIKYPVLITVIAGILTEIIIEMFNQRSFTGGLCYVFKSPVMFAVNSLIIIACLSLTLFFKKRRCYMFIISMIWIVLSVVNFVIRTYRTTPLRAIDFRVAKSVMNIVNMYFKPWQIVGGIILLIAILVGIVFLWIKTKKITPKYKKSIVAFLVSVVLAISSVPAAGALGALPEHFDNLTNAYVKYGFVYCFTASIVDNGISKPDTYSQINVERIKLDNTSFEQSTSKRPNIIFVQLESFFDVSELKNFTYSEDPTPCFNELKESCPGGRLTVASFGTGTANTEFDVLTGMNVQFFGAGETPYSTILREKTCESINYALKDLGYSTHALHDHKGNFYARNKVYPKLGFDSFTSVEYMQNVEYNVLGWAKDKVLIPEIMDTLDSTEDQDFIFTVSVQPHGRYSEEVIDDTQTITLQGAANEGQKNAYEYYINQLNQTDAFVGGLIDRLKKYDEPTVVVFYGDHLPNIGMNDEDLDDESTIYETEYVIWNNYGIKFRDMDLASYQLSSYIMKSIGFENWELANLHYNYSYDSDNELYMRDLKMIQYDILYGEGYYYSEESPRPKETEMTMGIHEIYIDDVKQVGKDVHVYGDNFTASSVVSINSDKRDTEWISPSELVVKDVELEVGDSVRVFQMVSARAWLSRTDFYYYMLGSGKIVDNADLNETDAGTNARENFISENEK